MVSKKTKEKARKQMNDYLAHNSLKHSQPRNVILDVFLDSGKHLTSEDLYLLVQDEIPDVGMATIYRALKLFCECGLADELNFNEGKSRYEPLLGKGHHDHLICNSCNTLIEVQDKEIEDLQKKLSHKHGFLMESHKLEIYGFCSKCQ